MKRSFVDETQTAAGPLLPGGRRTGRCAVACALWWLLSAACSAPEQTPPQLVRLAELPGAPAAADVEIGGLQLPSLPGAGRIELALPEGLPERLRFTARLGLLDEVRRPGVRADFRVSIERPGERRLWVEARVEGTAVAEGSGQPSDPADEGAQPGTGAGWQQLDLEVDAWPGARLILETVVHEAGASLPAESAVWGNPMLLTGSRQSGPNLIVVAVDTLRADVLGAYGAADGLTPEIDALAVRGIRFADLSAPSPWTLPSFATLATGLSPPNHGAGERLEEGGVTRLSDTVPTLSGALATAGLRTAGIYNNVFLAPAFGHHRGFDEYVRRHWRDSAGPLVEDALSWIDAHGEERFFLFLQLLDPHTPYKPPRDLCRSVARRLEPTYSGRLGCSATRGDGGTDVAPRDRDWARALYRAEVASVDRSVGRLVAALEKAGRLDNTLLLLVSDHGEELWEREERSRRLGYQPVADHGHTLYQELLRVPGILWQPGRPARVVERPVQLADLFPTLLALMGVEPPPSEGRDLSALLVGDPLSFSEPTPSMLGSHLLYGPPRHSMRRGPWKLIEKPGGGRVELYHLEQDPAELADRSASDLEVVASLQRALAAELRAARAMRESSGRSGDSAVGHPDAEDVERLRALGYIQ